MRRDELVRKLRQLRRLERRLSGEVASGPTEVWDRFFSTEEGVRVKYPLVILLAFDRASRERAFRDYLLALWAGTSGEELPVRSSDRELIEMLGLGAGSSPDEVRRAFRGMALEMHPDIGGDEALMRELIERYRNSSYGGRGS